MKIEALKAVQKMLEDVGKGCNPESLDKSRGLCTNIDIIVGKYFEAVIPYDCDDDEIYKAMTLWSEYSGHPWHPVPYVGPLWKTPGFKDLGDAQACIEGYWNTTDKYVGPYGDLRRELAAFLAVYIEKEML